MIWWIFYCSTLGWSMEQLSSPHHPAILPGPGGNDLVLYLGQWGHMARVSTHWRLAPRLPQRCAWMVIGVGGWRRFWSWVVSVFFGWRLTWVICWLLDLKLLFWFVDLCFGQWVLVAICEPLGPAGVDSETLTLQAMLSLMRLFDKSWSCPAKMAAASHFSEGYIWRFK